MTTATVDEGLWSSDYVKQMRSLDSYDTYDGWPNERVLARVKTFYNALAVLIEKESGLMATCLINIAHEGFGRALITVGKLLSVALSIVGKLKRIASEWASRMHDLVEDRLPAGYEEIPGIAKSTYEACEAWAEATLKLRQFVEATTAWGRGERIGAELRMLEWPE